MKNHKYKASSLSPSMRRREFRETLDKRGLMMIKNQQLPFLKKGVYVKDTMNPRVPNLRKERDDRGELTNTLYSKIYPLLPFIFLLALSGCMGVYEGGFECPASPGVGCKSISEVNDLVNAGELPQKTPSPLSAQKPEIWYSPAFIREHVKQKRTHGKVPF